MIIWIATSFSSAEVHKESLPPVCCCSLSRLTLRRWRWARYAPRKCRLIFGEPYDITNQKIILFMVTAVRTSNRIYMALSHIGNKFITLPLSWLQQYYLNNRRVAENVRILKPKHFWKSESTCVTVGIYLVLALQITQLSVNFVYMDFSQY
jgi:hypothetical protein